MSRNLINCLVDRAKKSGRKNNKKYIVERTAIVEAVIDSIKNNKSKCSICGGILDYRLVPLKIGDDGYIPNNKYTPSCDRIVNGGKGYISKNIRMAHRGCNINRKNKDAQIFVCKIPRLNLIDKTKFILKENKKILEQKLNVEIKNKKHMKNNVLLFLSETVKNEYASVEDALDILKVVGSFSGSSSKTKSYMPTSSLIEKMFGKLKCVLRKNKINQGYEFSLKEISKKASSDLGITSQYFSSIITDGTRRKIIPLVNVSKGKYKEVVA